ncbi:MAG: hypothetical protein OK441_06360 [Thaumarchaeota archaeon]|nr:hypothetical protein [Nitrososphaerota archaeon]
MPRGLGEDPLSRKRRSASTRKKSGIAGSVSMTPHAGTDGPGSVSQSSVFQPAVQGIPAVPAYNEVFFQRRADDGSIDNVTVASVAANPEPAGIVATPEPIVDTAPAAPQELAPVESVVSEPEQELREAVAPAVVTAPLAVEVKPTETEKVPSIAVGAIEEPPHAPPENQRGGFFSRIFGRRRK